MSIHKDRMKKAIEFDNPDIIPMDLTDVPLLYDAYDTIDPKKVIVPRGAEGFDSAWCTYHWTLEYIGKNERGEVLRRDEWGCTQVVPTSETSAYSVINRPQLHTIEDIQAYSWPNPENTGGFFARRKEIIEKHYPDRFINGFLDPGPFLVAFEILGYENLLFKLYDDPPMVKALLEKIFTYQKALIPRFREMGADMITIIDEVAGGGGMMFSPEIFRSDHIPLYKDLFKEIHRNNMYVSVLFDGDISAILEDLLDLDIDLHFFAQPKSTGIRELSQAFRGKRAVKMTVDMMETLASADTQEIEEEVKRFVEGFCTDKGGLVFQALRWHRPEYPSDNVAAQIKAMNRYR
jgi:uroporphyrinogen-III decarboxylase